MTRGTTLVGCGYSPLCPERIPVPAITPGLRLRLPTLAGLPLSGSGGNFIRCLPGGRFSLCTRFPVGFPRVTFLRHCL